MYSWYCIVGNCISTSFLFFSSLSYSTGWLLVLALSVYKSFIGSAKRGSNTDWLLPIFSGVITMSSFTKVYTCIKGTYTKTGTYSGSACAKAVDAESICIRVPYIRVTSVESN